MGWEDPLEKGKATHSSILAWRIPRTVWSRGSERVRHHGVTFTFIFSTSRLNRYCTIIYMLCIIYSCCISFTHVVYHLLILTRTYSIQRNFRSIFWKVPQEPNERVYITNFIKDKALKRKEKKKTLGECRWEQEIHLLNIQHFPGPI